MIKKAVLLTLSAPFLMVFSDYSYADYDGRQSISGPWEDTCIASRSAARPSADFYSRYAYVWLGGVSDRGCETSFSGRKRGSRWAYYIRHESDFDRIPQNPIGLFSNTPLTDEQCSSLHSGSSVPVSSSSSNYLTSGGSFTSSNGACSVTGSSSVCSNIPDEEVSCTVTLDAVSTGSPSSYDSVSIHLNDSSFIEDNLSFDTINLYYLTQLPGSCTDNANCVSIGDKSYLVDWDSAPDHFEYVGSDGNTYSKPSSGGGSGGDNGGDTGGGDPTDPTNPTDPTDPGGNDGGDSGGDSGGSDGGNGSGDGSGGSSGGGGSTVPEFEFDESGIIEAIRSSGQSNRNAIDALSNDVTGAISNQTNQLNNATSAQTDALSGALNTQTGTLTNSLDSQTDSVTSALDDQTGTLTGSLDALGTSIVDAINALGSGEGEGESDGEGTEGDGLLDGISNLFNGLVDDLASRFTEDLGDGDDLFNSSGLDNTLDNVAAEEQAHTDEINTLMDEIGDGATSSIADQVTSRLPSLPSGSCTPMQFGDMEISCRPFDTIKAWLTWIIYFWTVVSVIDTFFRSGQRTA